MAYLHESKDQFEEAVHLAVRKTGLTPEIIEKDYYVTEILRQLDVKFDYVVFKGGTSLQKCHRVIARFSEDIDITIDAVLSQSQKRVLKYGIVNIAENLGMTISNIDEIRSRRDYNRYILQYTSAFEQLTAAAEPAVLLETSFFEVSFPTVRLLVHSYIGDLFAEEAPAEGLSYGLSDFSMKVQGIDRTLVDKVFAICDYVLKGKVRQHSRHIYDIYKLLPLVSLDDEFGGLIREVRAVRAETNICPSAQPEVNVTALLQKIISEDLYKADYNQLTVKLLEESVSYEQAITAIRAIADSGIFD